MTARRLAEVVGAAAGFLRQHQRPDGGWGYHTRNRISFTEPTAWAVTALRERPAPGDTALERAVEFLLTRQGEDGGWANLSGMPGDLMTARVVFALAGLPGCASAVARGAEWLLQNELEGGWGWCHGTTGFVETAAYAILALSSAGRLGDVDRLARYVRELRCTDGGWGSHVPVKLGFPQSSQPSVTPLGIVALRRLGGSVESDEDLRASVDLVTSWVERGTVTTAYSLAMILWALREANPRGPAAVAAAERALACAGDDGGWNVNVLQTAMMVRGLGWLAPETT